MATSGGQPGNKNAVKNRPITDLIRRALAQNDSEKARRLAEALIARAIAESDKAATEILDRVEGKVTQPIAGTGEDGELLIRWLGKS